MEVDHIYVDTNEFFVFEEQSLFNRHSVKSPRKKRSTLFFFLYECFENVNEMQTVNNYSV